MIIIRYKYSTKIFILLSISFACIFYLIDGILVGTILLIFTILFSSITHNCYEINFDKKALCIKMICSKNVSFKFSNIKTIQLDKQIEEMRLMGHNRYIHIVLCNNEVMSYNIEPIASKKFEFELDKFCRYNNIPYIKDE